MPNIVAIAIRPHSNSMGSSAFGGGIGDRVNSVTKGPTLSTIPST